MCRHCERLIEDVNDKKLMHDFMESVATKVNRKINEDLAAAYYHKVAASEPGTDVRQDRTYTQPSRLERPVTADDISLSIHVQAKFWHDNPFNGTNAQARVFKMLRQMWE